MQFKAAHCSFSRRLTLVGVGSNRANYSPQISKDNLARHQHTSSLSNSLLNHIKPVSIPIPVPIKSRLLAARVGHYRSAHRSASSRRSSIVLGHHVKQALANGCPVVALESTVITHGLPEPKNLELALRLEDEIATGQWWCSNDTDKPPPFLSHSTFDNELNHNNATRTDSAMRGQVVTPATVGIVRGQLIVGLTRDEIKYLADTQSSRPIKASRRDIPLAQALGLSAGTTVSATMAIATSVGGQGRTNTIAVFATGGLGGVHLGGEQSMDISADLYEMARSPIGVVSSGFKSFLDSRRSLEFLETMGCTVTSLRGTNSIYQAAAAAGKQTAHDNDDGGADDGASTNSLSGTGRNDVTAGQEQKMAQLFPGFFSCVNKEQIKSPWQCDTVQEAAEILFHCLGPNSDTGSTMSSSSSSSSLGLHSPRAMLLACPIPRQFSLDQLASGAQGNGDSNSLALSGPAYAKLMKEISDKIEQRRDLSGNQKTPLILDELARRTGGLTLEANLILLRNNARVGAHLAYEYAKLSDSNRVGELQNRRRRIRRRGGGKEK